MDIDKGFEIVGATQQKANRNCGLLFVFLGENSRKYFVSNLCELSGLEPLIFSNLLRIQLAKATIVFWQVEYLQSSDKR